MLSKLVVVMEKDPNIKLDHNISSLLHGILMEQIPTEKAMVLHETGLKPYSQYPEFNENIIRWNIHTLTADAKEDIIQPMLNNGLNIINIKHKNLYLKVKEKTVTEVSFRQLIENKYFEETDRYINLRFFTPCSFKTQGKYTFYPTLRLLYQSLINKFDAFSTVFSLKDDEVLDQLTDYSEIISYQLKSNRFHLEGVKIPSFTGRIGIKINGPQPMVNLIHTMLAFGEYSGVGIKCSLGMGGVQLEKK